MFAWFMAGYGHEADRYLAPYKSRLFRNLSGTVLEIGPGAGANLRHIPAGRVRWIGVEPNRYMKQHLLKEANRLGIDADLRLGIAEELPIETSTVDFVISTLVLCSVVDQPRAVREILRVLKPGGKLLFIEHVGAPQGTALRRIQTTIKPLWRRLVEGCNPDRDTREVLEDAGFASITVEEFTAPLPIVKPHLVGCATKRCLPYPVTER